jgi:hypothetical protein
VLAFSEYKCDGTFGGNIQFTPTGNSGGGGVGGNTATDSFVVQQGVYQIQFNTSAALVDNQNNPVGGIGEINVILNSPLQRASFLLAGDPNARAAAGSKLFTIAPTQTLTFGWDFTNIPPLAAGQNLIGVRFRECYMTLSKLQ